MPHQAKAVFSSPGGSDDPCFACSGRALNGWREYRSVSKRVNQIAKVLGSCQSEFLCLLGNLLAIKLNDAHPRRVVFGEDGRDYCLIEVRTRHELLHLSILARPPKQQDLFAELFFRRRRQARPEKINSDHFISKFPGKFAQQLARSDHDPKV